MPFRDGMVPADRDASVSEGSVMGEVSQMGLIGPWTIYVCPGCDQPSTFPDEHSHPGHPGGMVKFERIEVGPVMSNIERSYDIDAVVAAHKAACARTQWFRLSDMEYDAIAGTALRTATNQGAVEARHERLRFELADLHRDYKTAAEERTRLREQLQGAKDALKLIAESADHPSLTVRSTSYLGKIARNALTAIRGRAGVEHDSPRGGSDGRG
jgi:hypothetical protein